MTDKKKCTLGVVLAGGKSTRMGGLNKGLVTYNNKLLFEHAVTNLRAITDRVLVNSNSEKSVYQELGFEVIDDGDFPYAGPLAGIYAGLMAAEEGFVAFAPCDQLTLPETVYSTLLYSALNQSQPQAVYAVDGKDVHPLCCIVPCTLKNSLMKALDAGDLKVQNWMKANGQAMTFANVEFANINQIMAT